MKSIAALEEYIDPCVELIQRAFDHMIEEAPDKSSATLELHKWLHFFTSDAIGELAVSAHIVQPVVAFCSLENLVWP